MYSPACLYTCTYKHLVYIYIPRYAYKTNNAKARLFPLRVRIADGLIWQVGEDPPVLAVVVTPASCKASERKKKKIPPTQQTRSAVRSRWSLAACCWGYYSTDSPVRVITNESEESPHTQ